MKLGQLLSAFGSMKSPLENDDSTPDDETKDRALRSLRRQKRRIDDEKEKRRLREQITKEMRRREAATLKSLPMKNQNNILKPLPKERKNRLTTTRANLLVKKKRR